MTLDEISDTLRGFIAEAPQARQPIFAFLKNAATSIEPGASVLDVGAGDAPYRELFTHVRYRTCDRPGSGYRPEVPSDIEAQADSIPLPDAELDAIICTQVLEHVPEPGLVLAEFRRLLKPEGRLWLTAPLVWYLHEEPNDYYRYTSHGLRFLLERAGFRDVAITPLSDSLTTLAQLVSHLGWVIGRAGDGYDEQRDIVAKALTQLAPMIGSFADFDAQWLLPMNYSAAATR